MSRKLLLNCAALVTDGHFPPSLAHLTMQRPEPASIRPRYQDALRFRKRPSPLRFENGKITTENVPDGKYAHANPARRRWSAIIAQDWSGYDSLENRRFQPLR